jgi:hypothetical protein
MSETNTQENNVTPITEAPTAKFNADVEQAMALTAPTELPVPQEAAVALAEHEVVEASTEPAPTEKKMKLGGFAALAAAGTFLAGSFMNGISGDKEPPKPEEPVGLSEVSQPYELGSESIDGNKIDTTSEVALQVVNNVPGEQGGLDTVARDINERTEQNETSSISETVWVPENADVNPDKPGVQLVEKSDDKPQ